MRGRLACKHNISEDTVYILYRQDMYHCTVSSKIQFELGTGSYSINIYSPGIVGTWELIIVGTQGPAKVSNWGTGYYCFPWTVYFR